MSTGIIIHSQEIFRAKDILKNYIETWFRSNNDSENWFVEVNGVKFPSDGMEYGLKILDENLKKTDVSATDRKMIRDQYVQTYIDHLLILSMSYDELLENPDLDILFQDFLRQIAMQNWLESQMKKDPKAIEPTEEELTKYYKENSERLMRLGLSVAQIKSYSQQEIKQYKIKEWTQNQIQTLKKQYSFTLNNKMKKKLGL